jgi:hypothetical protein
MATILGLVTFDFDRVDPARPDGRFADPADRALIPRLHRRDHGAAMRGLSERRVGPAPAFR